MPAPEFERPFFGSKIFEFWGGDFDQLNDPNYFTEGCKGIFDELGISVISGPHTTSFKPQGLSVVATFQESHGGFHTWPELGYARGFFEVCSPAVDLTRLPSVISNYFDYREIVLYHVESISLEGRHTLPSVLTTTLKPFDITHFTKKALDSILEKQTA